MNKYLFVAEADQIQDFVFQASRLQEVMGGSQLLADFCEKIPTLLGIPEQDVLVHAGGKFIIEFAARDKAVEFGNQLAEAYRHWADGSLTVAQPIEIKDDDFHKAMNEAETALRRAKRWHQSRQATPHLQYVAICASCGAGLAVTHRKRYNDETEKYICRACMAKAEEREGQQLLNTFAQKVNPGSNYEFDLSTRPKHISKHDRRRYVAYLVADGNSMGQVFKDCNRDQLKRLSKEMQKNILPDALAYTTAFLMRQADFQNEIPIWPLILGGDDVFAVLPAPWALDFALQFCQKFEQKVQTFIEDILKLNNQLKPTISASVVICKETYPHNLAHQIGEQCLQRAKQLSKVIEDKTGESLSTVDFEIVTGSQVVSHPTSELRSTLRPYYILTSQANSETSSIEIYAHLEAKMQEMSATLKGCGLPLHRLIQQRWALNNVSQKRLHQIRATFDQLPANVDYKPDWLHKINNLIQRATTLNPQTGSLLKQGFIQLGNPNVNDKEPDYLLEVDRRLEKEWFGHGLPDLLTMWDFAFSMDKQRAEYGEF
jgi:hypothetical protein